MPYSNTMNVRRAALPDLDSLLPLLQAYRVFYRQTPDAARERAFLRRHLESGSSVVFLAETDGVTVGFAQLFPAYSTVHLAPSWILEDLFVLPQYRKTGVATELLRVAVEHARDSGASSMFLETARDNETAQRVYERSGWTREARFFKYNAPIG